MAAGFFAAAFFAGAPAAAAALPAAVFFAAPAAGALAQVLPGGDLLARGSLDAVIESDVSILDIAALSVIVREAGGTFTDWTGISRIDGGDAVSSNGVLHDQVLGLLRARG